MNLLDRIRAVRDRVRAQFVDDWKKVAKRWSVWLITAQAALTGFAITFPGQAMAVWTSLPQDVRDRVPGGQMFLPTVLAVSALVAAMLKQGKSGGND